MKNANLLRRFGSLFYESIILISLWVLSSGIYFAIYDFITLPQNNLSKTQLVTQHPIEVQLGSWFVYWAIIGMYFIYSWVNIGFTLPQKTWKIQIVDFQGFALTIKQAFLRYLLMTLPIIMGLLIAYNIRYLSIPFLLINFIWAFIDRDQQFLHDRFASTRIVDLR